MDIFIHVYNKKTLQTVNKRLENFFTEHNAKYADGKCRTKNIQFKLTNDGLSAKDKDEKGDAVFFNELCNQVFTDLTVCTQQDDLFTYYMHYPEKYLQLNLSPELC